MRSGVSLVSQARTEPLTNAETVRLGRRFVESGISRHVSYPDDTPTVVVEVWDFEGSLPADLARDVEAVIGAFDTGPARSSSRRSLIGRASGQLRRIMG